MDSKADHLEIIFLVNELNQWGGVHTFAKNLILCLRSMCAVKATIIGVKTFGKDVDCNYRFDLEGVFEQKLSLECDFKKVNLLLKNSSVKIISLQFYAHLNFQYLLEYKDVVLMFHGDVKDLISKANYRWQLDYLNLFVLHNYRKIVVLSERNMNILKRNINPILSRKVEYIFNAKNSLLSENLFSCKGAFAFVGRLDNDKNIFNVLKIFSHPYLLHDITLDVYGEGPLSDEFRQAVKSLGLESRITMKGMVSNLKSIYQNKRGLIITSQSEGVPMVILEAYSHGIPVYCYDSFTAASELVEDGRSGRLIPNLNIDAFVEALNDSLVPSEKIIAKALQHFSSDAVVPKWIKLFDSLKDEAPASRSGLFRLPILPKTKAVLLILLEELIRIKKRLTIF